MLTETGRQHMRVLTAAAKHAIVILVLLLPTSVQAQECLHKGGESADQRARREAAIRYLETVNRAQATSQQAQGTYVPLNETAGIDRTPIGFLPRLLFDRWAYLISLKDFFDPCGFTLFSDERGVIYEAYPTAISESEHPPVQTRPETVDSDSRSAPD